MSQDRVPKHKRRLATDIDEVKNEDQELKYKVKTNDTYNASLGGQEQEKKQKSASDSDKQKEE